jgi:high-affinity iron transporter
VIQAFVIVLREGFEAFLIVAIIFAYFKKTGQEGLLPAVKRGVAASVVLSGLFGWALLQGASEPLWEGIFGVAAAVMVTFLVIQMLRTAPRLKSEMEKRLARVSSAPTGRKAMFGVFFFTALMIAREGMETALLLIQVHEPKVVAGILLGLVAATFLAFLWLRLGSLINLKLFFQVTALFLLLFVAQILLYSFHEFSEAGILPNSEALHLATEPYSPEGIYGRWISLGMVGVCAVWLLGAWARSLLAKPKTR